MYRKRVLGVIAALVALAALATAGAGFATLMKGASGPSNVGINKAAAAQILHARIAQARAQAKQLSTHDGVVHYLRSRGFDPSTFVIQRGQHNYAGPSCPGKRWTCTRAHHVVQFESGEGDNKFTCSPSYSPPPAPDPFPGTVTMSPNTCVIVQVNTTGGDNKATCIERSSSVPDVTQVCDVYQVNDSGNNRSSITQVIDQHDGQGQHGTQHANLTQQNGSGKNVSDLSQLIRQFASASGPTVGQDQRGDQQSSVNQNADTGKQNSALSQTVLQIASAGAENDKNGAAANFNASEGGGPVSGFQDQYGNGDAKVDQGSGGVSISDNAQSIRQFENAPPNSINLEQHQIGPVRCCTFQQTNPADKFTLRQVKVQHASTAAPSEDSSTFAVPFQFCEGPCTVQELTANGELDSSGQVHIRQFADQDGMTVNNRCDASGNPENACVAAISCFDGNCGPAQTFSCSTDTNTVCCPPSETGICLPPPTTVTTGYATPLAARRN